MRKNKVKIPFENGKGITDFRPLNKLNTSTKNIEKVKKIITNSLNNKMSAFKINCLVALWLPLGFLMIVLAAALLSKFPMVLLICVGIFLMLVYPFYICMKWSSLNKAVQLTAESINTKTKNTLICTPVYKKKIRRMTESTSSFKVLSFFIIKLNSPSSPNVLVQDQNNQENQNDEKIDLEFSEGTFLKKENIKMENVEKRKFSENIPLKLDNERNPVEDMIQFSKKNEANFKKDIKINHLEDFKFFDSERNEDANNLKTNVKMDMIQSQDK